MCCSIDHATGAPQVRHRLRHGCPMACTGSPSIVPREGFFFVTTPVHYRFFLGGFRTWCATGVFFGGYFFAAPRGFFWGGAIFLPRHAGGGGGGGGLWGGFPRGCATLRNGVIPPAQGPCPFISISKIIATRKVLVPTLFRCVCDSLCFVLSFPLECGGLSNVHPNLPL